jgi:hypothetical protein
VSNAWTIVTSGSTWVEEELIGEWVLLEFVFNEDGDGDGDGRVGTETLILLIGRERELEVGEDEGDWIDFDEVWRKGKTSSWKTTSREIYI